MNTFPGSPKLLKGGIVLIDPETARIQRIISLQYNPDALSVALRVQSFSERSENVCLEDSAFQQRNWETIS